MKSQAMDKKGREVLARWLEQEEKDFDSQPGLLRKPFSSPGYHTKLKGGTVHPTRENMIYASALLDSDVPAHLVRGKAIVLKIAGLQNKDENSPVFGIWPWFYEEPLEEMSPPDLNWADFLGKEFLSAAMRHREVFSDEEYRIIKETIYRACRAIIMRDVQPDYTNISLMGTYVTYITGEYFCNEYFLGYARKRLEQVYAFNMAYGNFAEYNSPSYTMTAAEDLSRFYRDIRSDEGREMVYGLLRIAWRTILTHFHETSGQWSGPHARSYTAFLSREAKAELQFATGGRLRLMSEKEMEDTLLPEFFRTGVTCFSEFLDEFLPARNPAFGREFYRRYGELCTASLYRCGGFSLGSFYKNEMWVQRDNVIAYFGTGEQPVMMKLQCLHDLYDFSAGQLHSVQKDGTVASILNFAVDGGDTHPSLDPLNNGTFEAEDIRIRLRLTGGLDQILDYGQSGGNRFYFRANGVNGLFDVPYAAFGQFVPEYEVSRGKEEIVFDIILYHGNRIKIDLNQLGKAVCGMVLRMREKGTPGGEPRYLVRDESLTLKITDDAGTEMEICAQIKPDTVSGLRKSSRGTVGHRRMEELGNGWNG